MSSHSDAEIKSDRLRELSADIKKWFFKFLCFLSQKVDIKFHPKPAKDASDLEPVLLCDNFLFPQFQVQWCMFFKETDK